MMGKAEQDRSLAAVLFLCNLTKLDKVRNTMLDLSINCFSGEISVENLSGEKEKLMNIICSSRT